MTRPVDRKVVRRVLASAKTSLEQGETVLATIRTSKRYAKQDVFSRLIVAAPYGILAALALFNHSPWGWGFLLVVALNLLIAGWHVRSYLRDGWIVTDRRLIRNGGWFAQAYAIPLNAIVLKDRRMRRFRWLRSREQLTLRFPNGGLTYVEELDLEKIHDLAGVHAILTAAMQSNQQLLPPPRPSVRAVASSVAP